MQKRKTQSELHPTSKGKFENLQFTDYTQSIVLDLVSSGEHLYTAAEVSGIAVGTLNTWIRRGRESTDETSAYFLFFQKYKHARLRGLHLMREKQKARKNDPQGLGDMPVNTIYNSLPMSLFTDETQNSILQYINEGAFQGVAAEASGVPIAIYQLWISKGKQEMQQGLIEGDFYKFYIDVMRTSAQARAKAEARVFEEMPLAHLLHGPGKETPEMPGWSKNSTVVGPGGGPVQVITEWKLSTQSQSIEVEGSVTDTKAIQEPNSMV